MPLKFKFYQNLQHGKRGGNDPMSDLQCLLIGVSHSVVAYYRFLCLLAYQVIGVMFCFCWRNKWLGFCWAGKLCFSRGLVCDKERKKQGFGLGGGTGQLISLDLKCPRSSKWIWEMVRWESRFRIDKESISCFNLKQGKKGNQSNWKWRCRGRAVLIPRGRAS